jgi:hypothetical protein
MNGRFTIAGLRSTQGRDVCRCCLADGGTGDSYEDAKPQKGSNHWSVTENSRNNARNVNFNNGNTNNNNKYNSNVVRPVAAFVGIVPLPFLDSVWAAYHDCLRGKMTSTQAIEYMTIADADIHCLAYELWTGIYKPGTSTCFLVRYPKWREVFAANFRDRIVHHWICLRLEPLFEERFMSLGDLSFNCRKGYGTEKAVEHVAEAMRRISDNYNREAWVFRGDLVGFFMSIDKDLLWYLLQRFILRWRKRYEREEWRRIHTDILARLNLVAMPDMYWDILLRTTRTIVMHHPELDCILNSPVAWWANLTSNKSLFTSPTGEPIGNLTTQLFANFLMSFFIAYVMYLYRRQNWDMAQFVDDFVIICDNLRFLTGSIPLMESFLRDKLKLQMHRDKRYLQPVAHGMLFVGTFIKPSRKYLSNRVVSRMSEHCYGFSRLLSDEGCSESTLQHIEQVLNSYMGFCRRRQTYTFRRSLIDSIGESFWMCFYVKGHYDSVRLKRRYRTFNI